MQNYRVIAPLIGGCTIVIAACSSQPADSSLGANTTSGSDGTPSTSGSGRATATTSAASSSTGSSTTEGTSTTVGPTSNSSSTTTTGVTTTAGSGGAATSSADGSGNGTASTTTGTTTTGTTTTGTTGTGGTGDPPELNKPPLDQPGESIFFGTTLDPVEVMTAARARAESQLEPAGPEWRATGDQHRTYHFDETNRDEPYRLYVPTDWDGESDLPMVMFLHGAGANENTYVDQNDQLLLTLAQQHGFLLVSAKGADGAYGNFLRLSAPFGNQQGAADLMAQVTPESERTNELSEQDVINVVELILEEYPIDLEAMFLTGHSMGSGGTWYIGGKYSVYWRAIAPMSGPFVQETGYPWDNLRDVSILVTEGTQTPSLEGSQLLGTWLEDNGFDAEYLEVDSDHGGMVPLVLPDVFEFFEQTRSN